MKSYLLPLGRVNIQGSRFQFNRKTKEYLQTVPDCPQARNMALLHITESKTSKGYIGNLPPE